MKACYNCGTPWQGEARLLFKVVCEKCSAWMHCCRNCKLYDPHAHNKCRSPSTDWVGDPEKQNYCGEFIFADRKEETTTQDEQEEARRKLDDLFGGSS
jgi:hypothetical protein